MSKPLVLQNAESYLADGLQAYTDADWNRAQWLFTRALLLYQGIDDQQGVLHSHINLAEVALSLHDYPTTRKNLDRATAIVKQDSLHQYQHHITLLYVQKALQQNRISLAESLLKPLLPKFELAIPVVTPDAIQMVAIANQTKIAFTKKQNEILWIQRYATALEVSDTDDPDLEARLLRFRSSWLQRQGKLQESESNLQQALSLYKKNLSRPGIAATLSELAELNITQNHWQKAQGYLNRSIVVYLSLKNLDKVIQATEKQVKVEFALGNLERSKALNKWISEMKNSEISKPNNLFELK